MVPLIMESMNKSKTFLRLYYTGMQETAITLVQGVVSVLKEHGQSFVKAHMKDVNKPPLLRVSESHVIEAPLNNMELSYTTETHPEECCIASVVTISFDGEAKDALLHALMYQMIALESNNSFLSLKYSWWKDLKHRYHVGVDVCQCKCS